MNSRALVASVAVAILGLVTIVALFSGPSQRSVDTLGAAQTELRKRHRPPPPPPPATLLTPGTAVPHSTVLLGHNDELHDQAVLSGRSVLPLGANGLTPFDDPAKLKIGEVMRSQIYRYPGGTPGSFWSIADAQYVPALNYKNRTWCTCTADNSPTSGKSLQCPNVPPPPRHSRTQNVPPELGGSSKFFGDKGGFCYRSENIAHWPNKTFSAQNFNKGYARNASVVYVLNLNSQDLDAITRDVQELASLPHPPTYIEMGNEYYYTQNFIFTSATDYMDKVATVIPVVRAALSNAKIAVIAKASWVRTGPWSADLGQWLSAKRCVPPSSPMFNGTICPDALTIHDYSITGGSWGGAGETSLRNQVVPMLKTPGLQGYKLWMTEFNLKPSGSTNINPVEAGLFTVSYYLMGLCNHEHFEMLLRHELFKQTPLDKNMALFQTALLPDRANETSYQAAAQILSHFMEIQSGAQTMQCLAGTVYNPQLTPQLTTNPPAVWVKGRGTQTCLQAVRFNNVHNNGGTGYAVLNYCRTPQTLQVKDVFLSALDSWTYTPRSNKLDFAVGTLKADCNHLYECGPIVPTNATVDTGMGGTGFTVPGYSLMLALSV